jgi:hypothetical protein
MASIANVEFWLGGHIISGLLAYFNIKASVYAKHDGSMIMF